MIQFPGRKIDKRYPTILVIFCLALLAVLTPKWLDKGQLLVGTEEAGKDQPATKGEALKEQTQAAQPQPKEGQPEEKPKIYVHIVGAVEKTGVFQVEEGARLFEALELAKPKAEAAPEALNLAEVLVDGQQYSVPTKAEVKAWQQGAESSFAAARSTTGGSSGVKAGASEQIIHINSANAQSLETLPGIGPALAAKIVEYRQQQGNFKSIEDLKKVSGIGEKKFEQLKSRIGL